jgi:hypothetical protein
MKQLFLGKSLQKPGPQEVSQKGSSPLKKGEADQTVPSSARS